MKKGDAIPRSAEEKRVLVEATWGLASKSFQRPSFHFRPRGGWMNDPNGTIYVNGEYHLFYQHYPYAGNPVPHMHWGHAKSPDLVHWEHLPVAIEPSMDKHETSCWSGCCVPDKQGIPVILYTSINDKWPARYEPSIWAARSTDTLLTWQKFEENPVNTPVTSDGTEIEDWRDPYAWREENTFYCLVGGHVTLDKKGGIRQPVASLYTSPDLITWKHVGPLCIGPILNVGMKGKIPGIGITKGAVNTGENWECPNFFPVDTARDLYCLVVSPHDKCVYAIGTYRNHQLVPGPWSVLDHGRVFYATNTFIAPGNRVIIVAWIRGGDSGKTSAEGGWDGCMSLPREATLDPDGIHLALHPAKELQALRGSHIGISGITLEAGDSIVLGKDPAWQKILSGCGRKLEIIADVEVTVKDKQGLGSFGLKLFTEDEMATPGLISDIGIDLEESLLFSGMEAGAIETSNVNRFQIHAFLDNSVVETFVNGRECITSRCYTSKDAVPSIEWFCDGLGLAIHHIDAWAIKQAL